MKKQVTIEVDSDDIVFGYWNEDHDDFVKIDDAEGVKAAAKLLKVSPVLIDALMMFADSVQNNVTGDMRDLWKRMDDLEAKLNAKG